MPAPTPDLRAFGVEVAHQRKERGWSIDRLAEATGVHRKTIIEIEAGRVAGQLLVIRAEMLRHQPRMGRFVEGGVRREGW